MPITRAQNDGEYMNSANGTKRDGITDLSSIEIKPAEAIAVMLLAGQDLVVEDVDGTQVGDLVLFLAEDFTERFSPGNTRKLNRAWLISEGAVLYSTKCRPLLRILEDTVGRNDMLFSSCSSYDYQVRFGVDKHVSCLGALRDVLALYEIPEYLIPDPLNIFQNTDLDAESGTIATVAPRSVSGSRMRLRAEVDCLVALSACPQDLNPCNGGLPSSLRVEFANSEFLIGRSSE